jgi:spermidine synthase
MLYAVGQANVVYVERSFFGVKRVVADAKQASHQLYHGTTMHGIQSLDPSRQCEALSYYARTGPIGQVFAARAGNPHGARVGVVGLGAGSLAGYWRAGDEWVFYEIDPIVERVARDPRYFTLLGDCAPDSSVVLGDARLSLAQQPAQRHDMLIMDAYSSDAIPIHLITREALALYLDRLAPHGVMAFHISNRHFDLKPALAALAADAGLVALSQLDSATPDELALGKSSSEWVLMARQRADFGPLASDARWQPLESNGSFPLWTDDYSSLLLALKR